MNAPDLVLYDGTCGLCHAWVRFLLRRDADGSRFRYSPLQGDEAARRIPADARAALPDSVVVVDAEGAVRTRSDAALRLFQRLGGGWTALARVAAIVPRPLRDGTYDLVARTRRRLFRRPDDLCPVVPPELAGRFLP
jgi:predicted DCC family thiol-disulfide oxidoreductase YuxK